MDGAQWRVAYLLTEAGVLEDQIIGFNNDGIITRIEPFQDQSFSSRINDLVIPGWTNTHCHSFQYAMAGLAENKSREYPNDNFWTWRNQMYDLATGVSPKEVYAIAHRCYVDMLRLGTTCVCEFHYLINDTEGKPYPQRTELADQIIQAAADAGIKICLIPVYYNQGDFNTPPKARQRRFLFQDVQTYLSFRGDLHTKYSTNRNVTIAWGLHSLRAAGVDESRDLLQQTIPEPFHMHLAEQQAEVKNCVLTRGVRPLQWVFDHCQVDGRFNFVHATHLDENEINLINQTDAAVILCPSTEGNLGDGIFNYRGYQKAWSLGTDSNVNIDMFKELQLLDYAQRLNDQTRLPFLKGKSEGESADSVYWQVLRAAKQASNFYSGHGLQPGQPFDAIVIDLDHPAFYGKPQDKWLSVLTYAADARCYKNTIVNGKLRFAQA